ncbi:hypothetical protein FRX31_032012 [Thalictrum thalictroides]|uniref:Uncharacterized protein n=1 Tax=Thalictrum thalictroides TaxID=46969 RepID=A0A7J6V0J4_THATH|nr:hypothetical protein FRX31_032012 [Thalictrum thalictroides]
MGLTPNTVCIRHQLRKRVKIELEKTMLEKTNSKTVQQPDLQPLNSSSDAADHQHKMHASSIGRNSNTGARRVDAGGVESKPLQQPDLQFLNCSSHTTDSQPSL